MIPEMDSRVDDGFVGFQQEQQNTVKQALISATFCHFLYFSPLFRGVLATFRTVLLHSGGQELSV